MSSSFVERLTRAARLDPHLYEEVEADVGANGQAAAIVSLSAVAAGIGTGSADLGAFVAAVVFALFAWSVWALLTWFIGTRVFPTADTHATYGELLRTIAFASAPGILRVVGIVPGLRTITFLVTGVWMLVAMIIAVRQALDYQTTGRAIGVCVVGWLVQLVLLAVLFGIVS